MKVVVVYFPSLFWLHVVVVGCSSAPSLSSFSFSLLLLLLPLFQEERKKEKEEAPRFFSLSLFFLLKFICFFFSMQKKNLSQDFLFSLSLSPRLGSQLWLLLCVCASSLLNGSF